MGFLDIFKKIGGGKKERMEIQLDESLKQEGPMDKILVRVENITGINDVERIERLLKEGNILLLKVSDLQAKDIGQFKQTVQMLKRRCVQFGWDIVGIEDGYIVITPKFAHIER